MVAKKLCAVCLPNGHFSKQARQQRCSKYELTRHQRRLYCISHKSTLLLLLHQVFFAGKLVESRASVFCVRPCVPAFPQNFVIKTPPGFFLQRNFSAGKTTTQLSFTKLITYFSIVLKVQKRI